MTEQLTHKFHSFTLSGRTGRLNFLGSELHGPKGTTIVLDYDDIYALVEAIGTQALVSVEPPRAQLTLVTGTNTPNDGAWTAVPAHPAHHRHKQEGS